MAYGVIGGPGQKQLHLDGLFQQLLGVPFVAGQFC